ncbi:MAG: hypothetical protein HYZ27_05605 [Deltaproteobacteria bacterium]|nr:hypothetical protein [Deltaproteobacteria bacterium]
MTIPSNAPNPSGATELAALLLSEQGRLVLERAGLRPLRPARCRGCAALPGPLRGLVE